MKEEEYLTKRLLIRLAKKAIKLASEETMAVMGYNVIALNGWVVKKYKDGTIEPISEIKRPANLRPLTLD